MADCSTSQVSSIERNTGLSEVVGLPDATGLEFLSLLDVEAEVEERVTGTKTIYAVAVVSAVNDGCGSVGSPRTM